MGKMERLLRRMRERWKILAAMAAFWAVLLSVYNPFLEPHFGERVSGYYLDSLIPLNGGDILEQSFTMPYDGMAGIRLSFEIAEGAENQTLSLELWDESGKELLGWTNLSAGTLKEQPVYRWLFEKAEDSKGKTYRMRLTNLSGKGTEGVRLYGHSQKADFETETFVNGEKQPVWMNYSALFEDRTVRLIYGGMWAGLILLSFAAALLIRGNYRHDFLVIAAAMGIGFLLWNPFPHLLDESTHFFRSFCISQGDWHDQISEEGEIGAGVPERYRDVLGTSFSPLSWYANPELYSVPFSGKEIYYENGYMSSVIPIDHSVSAAGIWLGRILSLPSALVIYLSRLLPFAVYLLFGWLTLGTLKYYRSVFFGVLLLPAALYLSGSCSQDPVLIGASLYFIACCLRWILAEEEEGQLRLCDMVPMLLTVPFVASIKYLVYTPIFLLILLIPGKRFKGRWKIGLFGAVLLVCAVMMAYQLWMLKAFPFAEDRNGYVDVGKQVHFVWNHLYAAYRNFGTYFLEHILGHIENTAVASLGDLSSFAGLWVVFGSMLAGDKYGWKDPKRRRLFLWTAGGIAFVVFGLIMAALYAGFTPVGDFGIDGLQTRYLFPFLPLLCLLFAHAPVESRIKNIEIKYGVLMIAVNATAVAGCIW